MHFRGIEPKSRCTITVVSIKLHGERGYGSKSLETSLVCILVTSEAQPRALLSRYIGVRASSKSQLKKHTFAPVGTRSRGYPVHLRDCRGYLVSGWNLTHTTYSAW